MPLSLPQVRNLWLQIAVSNFEQNRHALTSEAEIKIERKFRRFLPLWLFGSRVILLLSLLETEANVSQFLSCYLTNCQVFFSRINTHSMLILKNVGQKCSKAFHKNNLSLKGVSSDKNVELQHQTSIWRPFANKLWNCYADIVTLRDVRCQWRMKYNQIFPPLCVCTDRNTVKQA